MGQLPVYHEDLRDHRPRPRLLDLRHPRFFFFQAEDGIRDHCVTGVQTCALPISTLIGTINCLDHCRRHGAAVVFLSTSRVYPIASLRDLPLVARETRFVIPEANSGQGWSA